MQRLSVTNTTTDFSSFVTRIAGDTDVVFTPFQVAANANQVAVLLKEQGKRAIVFGGDGTVDPAFKVPEPVHVELRSGHRVGAGEGRDPRCLEAGQPRADGRRVRSAAYGAVQSILYAAKRACAGKSSIDRINIKRKMKSGPVPNWILGGSFRYSSKTNDPLNGGFWVFQIQADDTLKQLGRL